MNSLRVLIVDDEPLIRAGIRDCLRSAPGIQVVAECESGASAVRALTSEQVDLVFLDVQMTDISGLDVIERVGAELMPLVIFVTAYDEYAIKAFELNAVDYLLKPFDRERLLGSVERSRNRLGNNKQAFLTEQLRSLIESPIRKWPERIVVKNRERFEFVATNLIEWLESADNYTILHCGARQHIIAESLSSLQGRLNPADFLRIHRSRMINVSRVFAIHPLLSSTYQIELRGGTRLTSGRQYRDVVQRLLKN